jgi:VanZ family protein
MPAMPSPPAPWFEAAPVRKLAAVSLVLLLIIVSGLAFSPAPPPQLTTGWDKSNHFAAFASLTVNAMLVWRWARAAAIAAGLVGYGVLIELVQSQIPQRSGEADDVLADAVGIAIGLALSALLLRPRKKS